MVWERIIKMKDLINKIIDGAISYEDGETGEHECIHRYCEDNNIDEETCELAQKIAFERGASQAGIPLKVIRGEKKLNEMFSKDYIRFKIKGK